MAIETGMHGRAITACFMTVLFWMAGTQGAAAAPDITWTYSSFPPAYIEQNNTLQGYATQTQNWLIDRLPQYHHIVKTVPLARLLAEMRSPELHCSLTLIPTKRRKEYIYFAKPILISLPPSVVILAQKMPVFRPYLNDKNEIDINRLLANNGIITAIRQGRSYGQYIDDIVSQYLSRPNIITVGSDDKFIQLLEIDRLDWVMYLPDEAEYHLRQSNYNSEIISLPIANMPPFVSATMGCPKNRQGKQVIDAVNNILDAYPDMPWTQYYKAWIPPKDRPRYNDILKGILAARLSQPNSPF